MFHRTLYRGIRRFRMNPIVKVLILSDVVFWGADGLIAPLFAIFVTGAIADGSIQSVGIAAAVYLIVKSITELIVGWQVDRTAGERDDFFTAFWGTIAMGVVYGLYVFATELWHVYLLQFALGVAAGYSYPGWVAMFTRHLDRHREGFEWSVYDVSAGITLAIAALVGAALVEAYGFRVVFVIVSALNGISALALLSIRRRIVSRSRWPK